VKGIQILHFDVILAYKSNVSDKIAICVNETVHIVDRNKYRCYLFVLRPTKTKNILFSSFGLKYFGYLKL